MKKIILISIFSVSNFCLLAQSQNLTEEAKKAIQNQIEHVVDAFTDHLAWIADKEKDEDLKDYHIDASLDLFIGRGEKSYDENGNVKIPAPLFQVSNANSSSITSYMVRPYLQVVKNMKYTQVTYKNSKAYAVSDLQPTERDCEYTATLAILQLFIGEKKKDNRIEYYIDTTNKIYKVFVHCTKSGDGVMRWDVKIGDVVVEQTMKGNHFKQ